MPFILHFSFIREVKYDSCYEGKPIELEDQNIHFLPGKTWCIICHLLAASTVTEMVYFLYVSEIFYFEYVWWDNSTLKEVKRKITFPVSIKMHFLSKKISLKLHIVTVMHKIKRNNMETHYCRIWQIHRWHSTESSRTTSI